MLRRRLLPLHSVRCNRSIDLGLTEQANWPSGALPEAGGNTLITAIFNFVCLIFFCEIFIEAWRELYRFEQHRNCLAWRIVGSSWTFHFCSVSDKRVAYASVFAVRRQRLRRRLILSNHLT